MSLLSKNKPTPSTPRVRSLAEADQTYAAALALVHTLQDKMAVLYSEETDLLYRIGNEKQDGHKAQSAKVAALLGEETDDLPVSGPRARLTEIMVERRDLTTAIDIAQSRVQKARHAASVIICEEVRSEYTARVQAMAEAIKAFIGAHAGLAALTNDLESHDVAWVGHLRPLGADRIVSRAEGWLAEAREYGFIEKDKK